MPVRFASIVGVFAIACAVSCTRPGDVGGPVGPVELREVSVAALEKTIAADKGKVVLVDCWFLGCGPCRAKFPFFMHLHRQYTSAGLVLLTLNVEQQELDKQDAVLEYLKSQGADCTNLILKDDPAAVAKWMRSHEVFGTPAIVAFDRQGEWVPDRLKPKTDVTINDFVQRLLAGK
jgi:thiol-disulfide isomerase/thioredoxin